MITTWRLVTKARSRGAFDGEGSYLYGNRWNHPGTRVVYVASTTSLAALEVLVHAGSPDNMIPYHVYPIQIPSTTVHALDNLPDDWKASPAPVSTKDIGTAWAAGRLTAALRVPSVVVPWEHNYLLSVSHPEFSTVTIGEPLEFRFDKRL